MNMKAVHMVAYVLLWIGGLNWGLVGLLDLDLVKMVFGSWPMLVQLVYILVGLSAVYSIATHMGDCKVCSAKGKK
jgi:uncharacterized membrane protein YuzA (DUF378 family)